MQRGRKASPKRPKKKRGLHVRRLIVRAERLEIARGHDGPLRGRPEPCVVLGAYLLLENGARMLARTLREAAMTTDAPAVLSLGTAPLVDCTLTALDVTQHAALALLVLLVERDGGDDLRELHFKLETPARWQLWDVSSRVPDPVPLMELLGAPLPSPPEAEHVQLLLDGRDLGDQLRDDDWVGAACVRLALTPGLAPSEWRCHALSPDARNDWTLVLRVSVT